MDALERAEPPGLPLPAGLRRACRTRRASTAAWSRPAPTGLGRAGHGGDRILFGELLPIGKTRVFRKNTMKPILFLRELFCLDSRWRPYRGRTARLHGCRGYRKITGVNGFAYHPYTRPAGPRGQGAHARRRHDPLDRAHHAGARHRPPQGPHRRGRAERVEHRVRLPVQPARHPVRRPARRASPASCPSPSGSPTATRAWPATRSTRCATADDEPRRPRRLAGRPAVRERRREEGRVRGLPAAALRARARPERRGGLGRRPSRRRRAPRCRSSRAGARAPSPTSAAR